MVARKTLVSICDRCGSTKEVERRRLVFPDKNNRRFSFDACAECRATVTLADWEALMPRNPRAAIGQMVVSEAVVKKAARGRSARRVVKR